MKKQHRAGFVPRQHHFGRQITNPPCKGVKDLAFGLGFFLAIYESPATHCNYAVGTLPALFFIACPTNPLVRFGRRLDELNIWAPFRFCAGRNHPATVVP